MNKINLVADKRTFDPTDRSDLAIYNSFLKHNRWPQGCPFEVEWPNVTVTETIQRKIVRHYLDGLKLKDAKVS